ncbi:hypothetical protein EW146_g4025 [Bondarzewia mesenterica]|uniref:Metallo-beta-lactamase domain-containing protein n=1 Tax=Bondarzewia mesenterica TaxID=1095465 RepID=A0A4V3XF90_9AGAM|nr:hypothetical protein EW146_g4025 [Bondarzewia mesenterica]
MSCENCSKGYMLPGEPTGSMVGGAYYRSAPASAESTAATPNTAIVLLTDAFGLPLKNSKILADLLSEKVGVDVWVPDLFDGVPIFRVEELEPLMPDRAGVKMTFWNKLLFILALIKRIPRIYAIRQSVTDSRVNSMFAYVLCPLFSVRCHLPGHDMSFSPEIRLQAEALLAGRKGKDNFVEYEFKDWKGTFLEQVNGVPAGSNNSAACDQELPTDLLHDPTRQSPTSRQVRLSSQRQPVYGLVILSVKMKSSIPSMNHELTYSRNSATNGFWIVSKQATNMNTTLPASLPDQAYCIVSAVEAGQLSVPSRIFITPCPPDEHKRIAPALSFLLRHSKTNSTMLFDLGYRRDYQNYPPAVVRRVNSLFQPLSIPQDVAESLSKGGLPPTEISHVLLSHVHWDHIGDPAPFTRATFLVGSGSRELLEKGYPEDPEALFPRDLLPIDRTVFLDPAAVNPSDSTYAAFLRQWCFAQSTPPGAGAQHASNAVGETAMGAPNGGMGMGMNGVEADREEERNVGRDRIRIELMVLSGAPARLVMGFTCGNF